MAEIVYFSSRNRRNAEANLLAFINYCRHSIAVFGANLAWEENCWRGSGFTFGNMEHRGRVLRAELVMQQPFLDFAKAYCRYQEGLYPRSGVRKIVALRCIERALVLRGSAPSVADINGRVLDHAVTLGREAYSAGVAYAVGRELAQLAVFLTEKGLTKAHLDWKNPVARPDSVVRTGAAARQREQSKVPSDAVLEALAAIFASCPTEARDIFMSSVAAMLLCAPCRISELLSLPVDCEVWETRRDGKRAYGWRFQPGKGGVSGIKWIPSSMESLAVEAMARMRRVTEEARRLAGWLEDAPHLFYRHSDCPAVSEETLLGAEEIAAALGLSCDRRVAKGQALLQAVSDRLVEEATKRKTLVDKAVDFAKRVKLLKLGRIVAPAIAHVAVGTVAAGPLGTLFGAVSGLMQGFSDEEKRAEGLKAVREAYAELSPELKDVIGDKTEASLPKEIEGLRKAFAELLEKLDVRLVVFVDDLDRCLPTTAIGTLEAMRLLLHVKRTAFLIAADESMIRGAVRAHFKGVDIEEGLVTSYFDKLIQIPLRVPRLGINEVKAYLALLLTELAARKGRLSSQVQSSGQASILALLKKSWATGISRELLDEAFKPEKARVAKELDIADQLAPLLVTSAEIAGNPRLIKRFLNNLMIRQTIAEEMGMPLALEELVKIQLFERCASSAAFEFFTKAVASDANGKAEFLDSIETAAQKAEKYEPPHASWTGQFYGMLGKCVPRFQRCGHCLAALLKNN